LYSRNWDPSTLPSFPGPEAGARDNNYKLQICLRRGI